MRRIATALALAAVLFGATGCKKKIPDNVVKDTLTRALRTHASKLVSVMCGGDTQGLSLPTITITARNEDNTGTAHVKGSPTFFKGKTRPAQCEGDLSYKYTYTSRTYGPSNRRRTVTTWYLDHMKLLAVQTPGASYSPFEEDPEGDDDDDTN
jgi:hypothetical protein